jgi:hypothetical protein
LKIRSTIEMRRAWQRYIDEGVITSDAYQYALAQGYSEETLRRLEEGLKSRVRVSRARLAIQGAPHLYREREAPSNPGDPTPEWRKKHVGQIEKYIAGRGEVVPVKTHRLKSPIEQAGQRFEITEYGALRRYLEDADVILAGGLRISNWQSTGGGGAARLGGLGEVDQEYRDRLARHEWIESRLPPKVLETAKALVSRELLRPDRTPFSLEDFGGYLLPSVIDKNRRWGVSAGALCLLADTLVALYRVCPIRIRAESATGAI